MDLHAIARTSANSVTNSTNGALNAGSMRARTTGTNNNSGATKSGAAVASGRRIRDAMIGANVKNVTNTAQNTSGGAHAPGENENASHVAITVNVTSAAA